MQTPAIFLLAAANLALAVTGSSQSAPIVWQTLPAVNVPKAGSSLVLPLAGKVTAHDIQGPMVRFNTSLGVMDFELFPEVTPLTVANFQKYVREQDYDNTFVHRAVKDFVIQGGGYKAQLPITLMPTDPPLQNEYQRSNLTGTVAMAKLGGNLNSATSQWFINLTDNTFLNDPDQRFTVFARCLGGTLQRAIAVTNLPNRNLGGALNTLPLVNYTSGSVTLDNLVKVHTAREIPLFPATGTSGGFLTLSAVSSQPALLSATSSGSVLTLRSLGSGMGTAIVTVRAADAHGNAAETQFSAHVVDPARPVLSLALTDSVAAEPNNPGVFRITRTGSTSSPLAVNLSLAGGSATPGADFVAIPLVTSIPAGAAFKDIVISPKQDALKEGVESVVLSIAPGSSYTAAPVSSQTLRLLDDDVPQVVVSRPDGMAKENPTSDVGKVRFSRSGPTTAPLTVAYTITGTATRGADFTIASSPAVIPSGAAFVDVVVVPKNDTLLEGLETVVLSAVQTADYTLGQVDPSATIQLQDDDVPTVVASLLDGTASEQVPGASANTAAFRLTRTGSTTAPLTVYYYLGGTATHGIDYAPMPGAITIPAGRGAADVIIRTRDDSLRESTESVILSMRPSKYLNAMPVWLTATISDND